MLPDPTPTQQYSQTRPRELYAGGAYTNREFARRPKKSSVVFEIYYCTKALTARKMAVRSARRQYAEALPPRRSAEAPPPQRSRGSSSSSSRPATGGPSKSSTGLGGLGRDIAMAKSPDRVADVRKGTQKVRRSDGHPPSYLGAVSTEGRWTVKRLVTYLLFLLAMCLAYRVSAFMQSREIDGASRGQARTGPSSPADREPSGESQPSAEATESPKRPLPPTQAPTYEPTAASFWNMVSGPIIET